MPYETPINSKKTGGFALFDSLVQNGTRYIFGYPGGAILPLYDELYFWEEQNLIISSMVETAVCCGWDQRTSCHG